MKAFSNQSKQNTLDAGVSTTLKLTLIYCPKKDNYLHRSTYLTIRVLEQLGSRSAH